MRDRADQLGDIQRLGDVRIHARVQALLYVLRQGVGRQDRRVRSAHLADLPRRLVAVHDRHHHVHEHQIEGSGRMIAHSLHRFTAVDHRCALGALFREACFSDAAVELPAGSACRGWRPPRPSRPVQSPVRRPAQRESSPQTCCRRPARWRPPVCRPSAR